MAIVIGTAGHIDHGKTSLVKALTGVDCDRLEEEKKRGITIELGFAALKIDEETTVGIVDVPGHEKFVKNMVAGASGIDAVMLVIAADEGVMPQTREHLEICNLLNVKYGLVALTKIDSVDPEMLELAKEEVEEFLQGSNLENAPIYPLSSYTGEGIDALRAKIIELDKSLSLERKTNLFRLPVDRVFTMKGHGTVITGTSIAGNAALNDELAIYPKNEVHTRVRAIQTHGKSVEQIEAGKRISINVANCSLEDIERGDVLAFPNSLFPTNRWIVRLHCLKSAPQGIQHRKEVHFHHGAREISARVYLFDRQILQQGESALAEIRYTATQNENLAKLPLVGVFGDSCILRSSSPLRTIAGATLLLPLPYDFVRKDFTEEMQATFLALEEYAKNEPEKLVLTQVQIAGQQGRDFNELRVLTAMHTKQIEKALSSLLGKGEILCYNKELKAYISKNAYEKLEVKLLESIENFHKKEPLKQGMLRDMLFASAKLDHEHKPNMLKLAFYLVERLQKSSKLVYANDVYSLPSFKVQLASDDKKVESDILNALRKYGNTPPNFKEVLEELSLNFKEVQPIVKILLEKEEIIKLNENIYYDAQVIKGLIGKTLTYFESHEDLDPAAFKELSAGLSRKYIIAILEYFDKEKITLRVGDVRKLRRKI